MVVVIVMLADDSNILEALGIDANKFKHEIKEELFKEQKKIMNKELDKLLKIIRVSWQSYLSSYTPKVYERTGRTMAGIVKGDIRINGLSLEGRVNVSHVNERNINTYNVMSEGWNNGLGRIHRFDYYGGYNQKDAVLSKWNAQNQHDWLSLEWE